jgi:phosphoribosylanthranilate isomerase
MSAIRIKTCGITNPHDAELAVRLGADALGFNLYPPSPRYIAPAEVLEITSALPPFVEPVLLFVNAPISQVVQSAQALCCRRTLNYLQWHGDEPELPPGPPWRFIPAFAVADSVGLTRITAYLERCKAGALPDAVLIDGHLPGQYGGTGRQAPWHLLADFHPGVPVILAGGLTPENVAEAIRIVKPYAVDVASGVESAPGIKDAEKLRRFIDNVRAVNC